MESSHNIHTHCQVAQADSRTKSWQKVWLRQRTEEKRNNEGTTMAIRNAGKRADMKAFTLNKLFGRRTVKCLETPHYA